MNTKETKGDGTGAEAALVKARSNHNFDKRYKAARQASTTADRPIAMVELRVASFANLGHNGCGRLLLQQARTLTEATIHTQSRCSTHSRLFLLGGISY